MALRRTSVATNGIHMNMVEEGGGFAIVCIHGLGWDHTLWLEAFARYAEKYRVIAGDTRGHGATEKPSGPYSVRQFADDWRGALDQLAVDKALIVGLSQGGMVAMHLALDEPERFTGLVLVSTKCKVDAPAPGGNSDRAAKLHEEGPEKSARNAAALVFSPRFREAKPDYVEAFVAQRMRIPRDPLIAAMQAGRGFDVCDQLRRYQKPCLIIAGSEDSLFAPSAVQHVAEHLQNSTFVMMEGVGHMVPVEQPLEFYGHLDQFLDEHAVANPS